MNTKFVILTLERTGSNYLCALLDNLRGVVCHRELFHSKTIYLNANSLSSLDMNYRELYPIEFLNFIYDEKIGNCIGFKLFIYHNEKVLDYILKNKDIKIFFLYRDNILAQYSSKLIAQKTNLWVDIKGNQQKADNILWERKDFENFQKKIDTMYSGLRKTLNNREFFEIEYTQLFNKDSLQKMCTYLEIDLKFKISYKEKRMPKKQNSTNILERFYNKNEVYDYLLEKGKTIWMEESFLK